MDRCAKCGRATEVAATTCVCGADLWHGSAADPFPRASRPTHIPARDAGPHVREGLHPWCGPAAAGAFALGWLTTALVFHTDKGSTGTGFGNLGVLILALFVAACLAALGLILALFRSTRGAGSVLAFAGGAYAIGIVFGAFMSL